MSEDRAIQPPPPEPCVPRRLLLHPWCYPRETPGRCVGISTAPLISDSGNPVVPALIEGSSQEEGLRPFQESKCWSRGTTELTCQTEQNGPQPCLSPLSAPGCSVSRLQPLESEDEASTAMTALRPAKGRVPDSASRQSEDPEETSPCKQRVIPQTPAFSICLWGPRYGWQTSPTPLHT